MVGHSFCFVPGCTSGYLTDRKRCKAEGKRNKSLFVPPLDIELFDHWKKSIPRTDKELTRDCRVCELHFEEDEIERFHVIPLDDGSHFLQERGKPCLKKGAIPSIFPIYPDKVRRRTIERKVPYDQTLENSSTVTYALPGSSTEDASLPDLDSNASESDFQHLISHVHLVEKPNKWWGITAVESLLICAKWNEEYEPVKRLVVKDDLSVKVFLMEREISIEVKTVQSVEDITNLLEKIDSYSVCAGVEDRSMNDCLGYVDVSEHKKTFCLRCLKEKKRIAAAYPHKVTQLPSVKYKTCHKFGYATKSFRPMLNV